MQEPALRSVERQSATRSPLAVVGLMVSMGVPAAIAIAGIAVEGWDEIAWTGIVVWGLVATAAFTAFGKMGTRMGMTRMDIADLLGSVVAPPQSAAAQVVGLVAHHANGVLLAIAWAYGVVLVDQPANVWTGLVWGAILTALTYLMLATVGAVHPAIRRGEQADPGPAGVRLGAMTPLGSFMGHLVYGGLLGALYDAWPLS